MSGTPSPGNAEGLRRSIMSLSERVRQLADQLPDERWFSLGDAEELHEIRACLVTVEDELQRTLARWS
jgi:hypothetical protein